MKNPCCDPPPVRECSNDGYLEKNSFNTTLSLFLPCAASKKKLFGLTLTPPVPQENLRRSVFDLTYAEQIKNNKF